MEERDDGELSESSDDSNDSWMRNFWRGLARAVDVNVSYPSAPLSIPLTKQEVLGILQV